MWFDQIWCRNTPSTGSTKCVSCCNRADSEVITADLSKVEQLVHKQDLPRGPVATLETEEIQDDATSCQKAVEAECEKTAQVALKKFPVDNEVNFAMDGPARSATFYFNCDLGELQWIKTNAATVSNFHKYSFRSGTDYLGEWKEGMRHGMGTMQWPDGSKYSGQWYWNRASGKGCFLYRDGDQYIGEWEDNMASGHGTYYHMKSPSYSGGWRQNVQHGIGIEKWSDGSKYEGQYSAGLKHGYGRNIWTDGSTFLGKYVKNKMEGDGTFLGADGRCFKGQWRESKVDGIGHYTWPDGRSYRGQYMEDVENGFGISIWSDRRTFKGYWLNGKQHGMGQYTVKGAKRTALFRNGKKVEEVGSSLRAAKPSGKEID